jgi:hypothetical protein
MRYCHECGAEVGSKATECEECAANLIGSTSNSQGTVSGDGGFLASLKSLFDRGGAGDSSATSGTETGGASDDDSGDESSDDEGMFASITKRFG